ncbi:putative glycolipid-binding domain-containing protein [Deinococcus sp. SDU3-2]|uniref:Putative glycolipid-binding domain-containing protein n=1 Tax=Deinococcus terrestris TaxID=2651870 RepID=A0A7X1NTM3_9DEIO|nr:putative glycolipid-binding domain-containing protein [Deinococcus terrestris]MPY65129.1 putative glycolipid-binding domain-containing protein [Deinococcus terrestris]
MNRGAGEVNVVWQGLNPGRPSLEHLRLIPWVEATGTVVGVSEGRPFTLLYRLDLGGDGSPIRLRCHLDGGQHLDLSRSGEGEWTTAEEKPLPLLRGCTDVDLRVTPFTNTLPLRRLNLRFGEGQEVHVVWVDVPSLDVQAARQRYTRTDERTYRYENMDSGYSNEVTVDGKGLVTLYPDAFERLA